MLALDIDVGIMVRLVVVLLGLRGADCLRVQGCAEYCGTGRALSAVPSSAGVRQAAAFSISGAR